MMGVQRSEPASKLIGKDQRVLAGLCVTDRKREVCKRHRRPSAFKKVSQIVEYVVTSASLSDEPKV